MRVFEGKFNGEGIKIAIVAARFNEFITSKLIGGAEDILRRHNVEDDNINLFWVPGAFEIPLIAQKLAKSKKYDAVITLGAVIKGSTPHFDYVCAEVSKGVAHVSLESEDKQHLEFLSQVFSDVPQSIFILKNCLER